MSLIVRPRFRELRGNARLLQIADDTGINAGTLSQIEHGQRLPLPKHVDALERAYGDRLGWYQVELVASEAA